MCRRCHYCLWYLGPCIQVVAIHIAQLKTGYQQSAQTAINIGFLHISTTHSLRQVLVLRTALHVGTSQHGFGTGFGPILGHVMPTRQEITNGTTVAGNQSVKAPFVTQYLLLVTGLRTTGLTVDTLIGTHHLGHFSFLH